MSNELVQIFGNEDYDAIAALTGADVSRGQLLPQLKINREAETEDGKHVPVGTYCIHQDGKAFYAKPILFRPFINAYQYMEYSPSENNFPNKSILIKSFYEEAHDELGGLKCGKVSKKAIETLGEADQAHQRNIKCYRVMFGIATLNAAVDSDQSKHNITVPCMWRTTGINFLAAKDALAAIAKLRHHIFQHNLVLNTKRDKQGSNVFYHALVEADLANVINFTKEDADIFKTFQEYIDNENNAVLAKWEQAKKSKHINNDLSDLARDFDLDDALPESMS